MYKPYRFISMPAGFQEKFNTMPKFDGNYHFWVRDSKTNKIIDPTPNFDGTCGEWTTGKRHYFIWSYESQKYKFDELWENSCICFGGNKGVWELIESIGRTGRYERGKCFLNAMAYILANDKGGDRLLLEGGACGYEIRSFNGYEPFKGINESKQTVINLDWGY
jgi:hypothetical protein